LSTDVPRQSVSRVGEMVLTIIGGIFGIIGGTIALAVGGVQSAVHSGGTNVAINGGVAIGFSALALVAAFFVSSKSKLAGWLLLASAIAGLIAISFFYILPFILLLIAGLMCLLRGRKLKHNSNASSRNTQPILNPTSTSTHRDPAILLQRLTLLKQKGAITEAQYQAKREELLARL
jgi:hypothetical protein